MKLSVIIAIYNVEGYLDHCINSISKTKSNDIEFILVNDGSTDNSNEICEKYAKLDKRIKYFKKENGGVVSARKFGLKKAIGDFIIFIDGDDWIDDEYFDEFMNSDFQNCDVIIMKNYVEDYKNYIIDKGIDFIPNLYTLDSLDCLKKTFIYNEKKSFFEFGINPALWNKFFKRDCLNSYFKSIPNELTLGEDFSLSAQAIFNSNSILILDNKYKYHYIQRNDSMVKRYDMNLIRKVNNLKKFFSSIKVPNYIQQQLKYYFCWIDLSVLKNEKKGINGIKNIYNVKNIVSDFTNINTKNFSIKYKILSFLIKNKKIFLLSLICSLYRGR